MIARRSAALLAVLTLTMAMSGLTAANAGDPVLNFGWRWSNNFVGTYRFTPSFPADAWMRTAASNAVNHISRSPYRNPSFNLTTSGSANVHLQFLNSAGNNCAGLGFYWVGCAATTLNAPFNTWWVSLANNYCWTNGTNNWCTHVTRFDLQSVTLNEMGHVNFLNHHVNPDYTDAVVQAAPVAYPNANWSMRTLRQMDNVTLNALYGYDGCTIPPCPLSAGE